MVATDGVRNTHYTKAEAGLAAIRRGRLGDDPTSFPFANGTPSELEGAFADRLLAELQLGNDSELVTEVTGAARFWTPPNNARVERKGGAGANLNVLLSAAALSMLALGSRYPAS